MSFSQIHIYEHERLVFTVQGIYYNINYIRIPLVLPFGAQVLSNTDLTAEHLIIQKKLQVHLHLVVPMQLV